MDKISENIKRIRLECGLTQQEVADKLFVTRQCISRWENSQSYPDVSSLEKLTVIFDTTINEIIDDESMKYIALGDSRKLDKWQKTSFRYIMVSIFLFSLMIIGIFSVAYNSRARDNINIQEVVATISSIDDRNISFAVDDSDEVIDINMELFSGDIFNYYNEEIFMSSLDIGYVVRIHYDSILEVEQMTRIQVLDYEVIDSLYGIVLNTTGVDYKSLNEMPLTVDPSGLRYVKLDGTSYSEWQHNLQYKNFTITKEEITEYRDKIILDVTVYTDSRQVINDAKIGLVTQNGIEYVDLIDLYYNTTRYYSGKIQFSEKYHDHKHSMDIEIRVSTINVNTMTSFDIYEYDMNHSLILSTHYDDKIDFNYHRHNDQAVYSILKMNYYEEESYGYSHTVQLMLGEKIQYYHADKYGLVWEHEFLSR